MTPSQITDTVSRVKDVGNAGEGEEGVLKEVGILPPWDSNARLGWLAGGTGLDFSGMTSPERGEGGHQMELQVQGSSSLSWIFPAQIAPSRTLLLLCLGPSSHRGHFTPNYLSITKLQ